MKIKKLIKTKHFLEREELRANQDTTFLFLRAYEEKKKQIEKDNRKSVQDSRVRLRWIFEKTKKGIITLITIKNA